MAFMMSLLVTIHHLLIKRIINQSKSSAFYFIEFFRTALLSFARLW
jgi:hypothetical protein